MAFFAVTVRRFCDPTAAFRLFYDGFREFGRALGAARLGGGFYAVGRARFGRLSGIEPGGGVGEQPLVRAGRRQQEAHAAAVADDDGADLQEP